MSKAKPIARYTLPDVVNPAKTICYQIEVPDNLFHRAAFFGQIYKLASAVAWDNDASHTALDVAAVWWDIFNNIKECSTPQTSGAGGADEGMELLIRQNPDNPCILETSINGTDWCAFADFSKCVGGPSQPGSGSPQPTPGGGQVCYHATLSANEQWLLPTPVNTGDTLVISNVQGAWADGSGSWYCPNGQNFVLFLCAGATVTGPSDPLNTQPHGSLIAKIDTTWNEVGNGATLTVPSGVVNKTVTFQMNDPSLSDNSGQLTFDVCVTNNQSAEWVRVFDAQLTPFTDESSWTIAQTHQGPTPAGNWVSGKGYGYAAVYISRLTRSFNWFSDTTVNKIRVKCYWDGAGVSNPECSVDCESFAATLNTAHPDTNEPTGFWFEFDGLAYNWHSGTHWIYAQMVSSFSDYPAVYGLEIGRIEIYGTGTPITPA